MLPRIWGAHIHIHMYVYVCALCVWGMRTKGSLACGLWRVCSVPDLCCNFNGNSWTRRRTATSSWRCLEDLCLLGGIAVGIKFNSPLPKDITCCNPEHSPGANLSGPGEALQIRIETNSGSRNDTGTVRVTDTASLLSDRQSEGKKKQKTK